MNLADYRSSAEQFVSQLTAEYYRHYAGFKDDYEIEPIYAHHADLFERQAVDWLGSLLAGAPADSDERRRLTMLLDFAVEGLIGQETKVVESELARREAALTITLDGEEIGFRESAVVQANEADPGRREELERARLALIDEHLNPLYAELVGRQHETARELGYPSYARLCEGCKGLDLQALASETASFSARTSNAYPELLEPHLRRTLGIGLEELRRSDLPRFFRAPGLDSAFPAPRLVPSLTGTMRGLGFDLERQAGVVLDVEPRPNKSPRAFCAPVRVPDEVYLVIAPVGGPDDYGALLHEGGHTEHYAHVDPALAFEYRYLGDNAVTEAFAFLFQNLVEDPEWLTRRLCAERAEEIASYARAVRVLYLRRYAGKLAYELELHGEGSPPLDALARRYAQLLSSALRIRWPRETYLADVDPGFYCSCYLRAWALERMLRARLRDRFGPAWFESREAGELLRSLWREGQRATPDELLGEPLQFGVLLADLGL
jgi:hypothetical protein